MNISNSGHVLSAFKMSQNNVVWPENISGKQHLFMYKGNSASKIDMGELYTDFGSSYDIRNDKVVFVKNDLGAIDYYDGVSTSNLVPRYGGGPVIDDSHIAYYFATIQSPTFQQLIIKDGSNSYVTNCENMTMNGHYICLNQGVAAWDNGNGIKMFDGTNVISVSSSHSSPTFMKLSGKLIYADYGSGQNEDLFLYDGSSPVKMNTNRLGSDCQRANYEGHADIDSGKVVWIENRSGSDNGGGLDVYYYDGFTKHHLATSANSRMRYFAPRISGNNIIWFCEDEISPTHQIYLCHFDGTLIRNLDIGNPHNAIYL
ncbi:MAG: hypothetical protein NTV01_11070, partial [Bacteroidia bacterium]|nr:hypothetical protein [Bacteroidia bacterium]